MNPTKQSSTYKYSKYYSTFSAGVLPGTGVDGQVMLNHTSNRWFH